MNAAKCLAAALCAAVLLTLSGPIGRASAADLKIGVVNMQKVIATSKAGKRAQSVLEQKMKTYDASFKKDRDSLLSMRSEIEKKSSAWSDSVKQEKFQAFQKKSAEFGAKEREANQEMRKLQEQHVQPVLKKLEEVIQSVAKSGNYDLIVPNTAGLFASGGLDVTDDIVKALDAAMK